MFIKYCVFLRISKYISDSGLSRFPLGVSVCIHNGRSNTSSAAELAEFRKITNFGHVDPNLDIGVLLVGHHNLDIGVLLVGHPSFRSESLLLVLLILTSTSESFLSVLLDWAGWTRSSRLRFNKLNNSLNKHCLANQGRRTKIGQGGEIYFGARKFPP